MMFLLQTITPIPTPTPVPDGLPAQIATSASEILNSLIEKGVLGFLFLLGIALIIYLATGMIRAYTQRNTKSADVNVGNLSAITTLGTLATSAVAATNEMREERISEHEAFRLATEKQRVEFLAELAVTHKNYLTIAENATAQTELIAKLVAARDAQGLLLGGLETGLDTFKNDGSLPVQALILTTSAIQLDIAELKRRIPAMLGDKFPEPPLKESNDSPK